MLRSRTWPFRRFGPQPFNPGLRGTGRHGRQTQEPIPPGDTWGHGARWRRASGENLWRPKAAAGRGLQIEGQRRWAPGSQTQAFEAADAAPAYETAALLLEGESAWLCSR
jgi:hypothetical protein